MLSELKQYERLIVSRSKLHNPGAPNRNVIVVKPNHNPMPSDLLSDQVKSSVYNPLSGLKSYNSVMRTNDLNIEAIYLNRSIKQSKLPSSRKASAS